MNTLRQWVHHRAHHGPVTHAHVSRQRRGALWLTIFAAIRTVVWLICMLLIVAIWCGAHVAFLSWFKGLSSSVIFVTFISFYCNASTDAANLMAGIAALFSADSHAAAVAGNVVGQDVQARAADVEALLHGQSEQAKHLEAQDEKILAILTEISLNTQLTEEVKTAVAAKRPARAAPPGTT